jgi:hypothetical protein
VLKRASTGKFHFDLVATNGQVIATSFATVMQAARIPVADSVDTHFNAAVRAPRWSTGTGGRPTRRQSRPTCPAL